MFVPENGWKETLAIFMELCVCVREGVESQKSGYIIHVQEQNGQPPVLMCVLLYTCIFISWTQANI